jgi:branched-chain amino acid aminotransferase
MIVSLNDKLVDDVAARIDPADRGFLLGDGVFETIAVRNNRILRLETHLTRLAHSCVVLELPKPDYDFAAIIHATLKSNAMADAVVRVTYTRGAAPRGVLPPTQPTPTLLVTVAPMPLLSQSAHCIVATVTRRNEHSPLSRIKSLNYLDSIVARQEAQARDADDAILLNTIGVLAEATSSNLFIVKNGRIMTPPVSDGALPGIMRAEILGLSKGGEQSLGLQDLLNADEAFLSNSLGLRSIASIDGKAIGDGGVGNVFAEVTKYTNSVVNA